MNMTLFSETNEGGRNDDDIDYLMISRQLRGRCAFGHGESKQKTEK